MLIQKSINMKQLLKFSALSKKYLAVIALLFCQGIAWAQDEKTIDVNLNVGEGQSNWYAEPWAIVVGAAVFIIILVALLRGRSKD